MYWNFNKNTWNLNSNTGIFQGKQGKKLLEYD